ncbi:hypothetical protein B0T20DRAFT_381010 [Sordaria brevicollis]|uniref:HMG box domain-containing protein n=1 Tax=Sordaria brevicollis TaxID=83679 RepID=A0AAE0PAV2_SORBR|nr:hypothetical protein B0T20DRAFT_381010 [Sordaria brevicollis]
MFSKIALTAARQLRAGTTLVVRTAAVKPTTSFLTTRSAVVFQQRGYGARQSRVATTETESDTSATTTKPKRTRSAAAANKSSSTTKSSSTKSSTTTKAKATTAGKTKAASKPKKEAAPKRPKKVLTDEEKLKLKIKQLKQQALLKEEPGARTFSAWQLFVREHVKEYIHPGESPIQTGFMAKLSPKFKALSSAELEALEARAEKEREATAATRAAWVLTKTPKEIMAANRARQHLRRLGVVARAHVIPDDRIPKGALSSWMWFFKSRTAENPQAPMKELIKDLAQEWKSMDAAAKQPFEDNAKTDRERYKAQIAALE